MKRCARIVSCRPYPVNMCPRTGSCVFYDAYLVPGARYIITTGYLVFVASLSFFFFSFSVLFLVCFILIFASRSVSVSA